MTSARVALPATALKRNTVTVLGGQEAKMSGPQLMFWNSIFLKKAKLNVYLTFFLQKLTLCFGLPPLDRRSLKSTFRQPDFVKKTTALWNAAYNCESTVTWKAWLKIGECNNTQVPREMMRSPIIGCFFHLICQVWPDPKRCPKKLDVARQDHVVIPLTASYEICNNWTNQWILTSLKFSTNKWLLLEHSIQFD